MTEITEQDFYNMRAQRDSAQTALIEALKFHNEQEQKMEAKIQEQAAEIEKLRAERKTDTEEVCECGHPKERHNTMDKGNLACFVHFTTDADTFYCECMEYKAEQ